MKNISIGKKVKLISFSSIMEKKFFFVETKITGFEFFIPTRMTTSISCEAQEIMD